MTDVPQQRPRRQRPQAEVNPFVMTYVAETHELSRMLTLQQLRVFHALTRQMEYNASFRYSPKRAAIDLGMTEHKVSAAIRGLKDVGVVLPVGPERTRVYLNPRYVWRGDRRGRAIAQLELLTLYAASSFIPDISDEDLAAIEDHDPTEPAPEEDR